MREAAGLELEPCPAVYEPPPMSSEPPPYRDAVERPAELPDPADESDALSQHRAVCAVPGATLRGIPQARERVVPMFEDFLAYVDVLRDVVDNELSEENVESLSAEIDAVVRARPADEDTLQLRYERLAERLVVLSPPGERDGPRGQAARRGGRPGPHPESRVVGGLCALLPSLGRAHRDARGGARFLFGVRRIFMDRP